MAASTGTSTRLLKQPASSTAGPAERWLGLAPVAALAAVPAALWSVALWDRTSLAGMSRLWAATWLAATLAIALWAWLDARRCGWAACVAGLLPAAFLSTVALAAVYTSGDAHHRFLYSPTVKGTLLPILWLLCLVSPALARSAGRQRGRAAPSFLTWLQARRTLIIATTLGAAGLLQAVAFCAVATDDAIRYWAVADGLRSGAGYPVTTGSASGSGFYLLELPLYPLLLLPSFATAGHRFLGLIAPLLLANVALPFVLYAVARAAGARTLPALWLSLALLCLPFYQSYALGAAQPEPLLAAALGLAMLATLRLVRPEREAPLPGATPARWWLLVGLSAGAAVLTRPEGALYSGPLLLALAWHQRGAVTSGRDRGLLLALACTATPVVAFALFLRARFDIWWPTGWANVAGPQFIPQNVRLALTQDLPQYAAAAGLPTPVMTGPLLALLASLVAAIGLWRLCRERPALWCIPVAIALNLAVIFNSPSYLTPDLFSPGTFFRHISVSFPWLVPAFAVLLRRRPSPDQGGQSTRPSGWSASAWLVAGAALLVWELAVLGNSAQRNQSGQPTALTSDPYVLVSDLWRADDTLPELPMATTNGVASVQLSFDYLAMRTRLFDAVRPHDQHVDDAGRAHQQASAILALAGLGALALAGTPMKRQGRQRSASQRSA